VNEEGGATRGWSVAARRLFFNTAITVVGLIRNTRAVSRMPLPFRAVDHLAADLGYSASILVVEEEDPPRAVLVLTPVALGSVGLLARLDDFCAVTVRTLHWDVDHRLPPRTILMRGHPTGKLLI
jgi:hypothetical protein